MPWYIKHSSKGTTLKKHKYIAIKDGRYIYPKIGKKVEVNGTGYGSAIDAGQVAGRKTSERAQRVRDAQDQIKKSLGKVNIGKKSKKSSKPKRSNGISAGDFTFDLDANREKKKKRRK